jgi:hypothetical protein
MAYHAAKDRLLRELPALDLGGGRRLLSGVFAYSGGTPTLRVTIEDGKWRRALLRAALDEPEIAEFLRERLNELFPPEVHRE